MELGLSLGEAMADAGRELVLGLGVGPGARREEERRRDQDVDRRGLALGCGSSPEPTMRLALLPMVPSLGFPWPSEMRRRDPICFPRAFGGVDAGVRRQPGAVVRGLGLGRLRGGGHGGGGAGGHRRGGAGGRVVLAQRQRGLLPDGLLRAGRARRQRRRPGRRRRLARQRRGRRRLGAQEAAPLQGAGRVPGGELQGAQHPQPQAEGGAGEAAQPPAAPGGGVVPEPQGQDEAEADGGGLRVPEALLRDADGGEPAAAEGAGGAARAQDSAPLLHAPPGDHPLHVPLLRARRLQLRPGARGRGARLRRRHCFAGRSGAEQALVVRRAVLVGQELPAGRPPAATSIAGAVELV
uniref:Uncharacterized protein n=1 Tax=Aegilops tauschii subsp. strangulata TaxID=200361 RepID=A0A453KXR4_AEGTS